MYYLFYIRKFIKHFQTSNFMLENQLQINKKYCYYTLNYFSKCLFYKYKIQFNNRLIPIFINCKIYFELTQNN